MGRLLATKQWNNKCRKCVEPFLLSENLLSDVIQVELQSIKVVIKMQFAHKWFKRKGGVLATLQVANCLENQSVI